MTGQTDAMSCPASTRHWRHIENSWLLPAKANHMKFRRLLRPLASVALLASIGFAGFATHDRWLPLLNRTPTAVPSKEEAVPIATPGKIVVAEQAQRNLGLKAAPLKLQTYWKTIQVPGMVVDRPGQSDRSIVAPATGVIAEINHFPGETVPPGEVLFAIKFQSESLHTTQSDLFKATQNIALAEAQRKRLKAVESVIPAAQIIEIDSEIARLEAAVSAHQQELRNRSFNEELVKEARQGRFVNEMNITVPRVVSAASVRASTAPSHESAAPGDDSSWTFELQDLEVELGQLVQAGQTLCLLSNHQQLAVEGRAFRDETALLERSVRENWPVEVDFREETADWGPLSQTFHIQHLANTIDPVNRTFAFRMPLENQSRAIVGEDGTQTLWRFRPGQKVLVLVRVERLDNVFVLPADAIASDGPESFIFTQNVNTFERKPIRILLHDRRQVVIANDGTLLPGLYAVQSAAEQLNRMVKSGQNTGVPKGYHIHADGSLHKNEDEVK